MSMDAAVLTSLAPVERLSSGGCCRHVGGVCTCVDCTCPSLLTTTVDPAAAAALAVGFAALSDPVRLRLVSLLATSPDGTACVCDLIAPLGKSQSTVSHHLKVLGDAGLVHGTKEGRMISYRLVDERLSSLRTALNKEASHD